MEEPVLIEKFVHDGVLLLILNRPNRSNALTPKLLTKYFDALENADKNPKVRVIIVTGSGNKFFSGGADLGNLDEESSKETTNSSARPGFQPEQGKSFKQIQSLKISKPIIAAINGSIAGLSLVLALHTDIRFCKRNGPKFTFAFAQRGLIAEHGSAWILPRIVGIANAMDLLLSARVFLPDEAKSMGIVNFLCDDPLKDAITYASYMAQNCSPTSMALIKQQVYDSLESDRYDSYKVSDRMMDWTLRQPDFKEGVRSFLEKRQPQFQGLSQRPKL